MKSLIIVALLATATGTAFAKGGGGHTGASHASNTHSSGGSHSIQGYTKKDGTVVAPAHATNPNNSKADNWSSKGNVNPYTGKEGTKDPVTGR